MPKERKRIDARQGSLLEVLERMQADNSTQVEEGSLDVAEKLRIALTQALKQCPLSRWEVAGKMSELLGQEVSRFMLDAWTAGSKEGHRFPAEYLPAFCRATGSQEPLRMLAQAAGMFALPGPDALRAEIKRLEEDERKVRAEKRKREAFLKQMEGGA